MSIAVNNRWQAFAIHLGGSLLIFISVYALTRLVWFPGDFFQIADTWQGIRIVIFVDLVLGPLLTLVVFDRVKKTLKTLARDLTVILIIQVAGLAAGVSIIHGERPVMATLVLDTLHVYTAAEVEQRGATEALDQLEQGAPAFVLMKLPEDQREALSVIRIHSMVNGPSAAGLESSLWQEMPRDGQALTNALRFAGDVRALPDCEGISLRVAGKHSAGRVCADFRTRSLSGFQPEFF